MSIDLRADAENLGPLIPGAYERDTLTYRQPGSMGASGSLPMGSRSMDAATIADREREGGGAPSQRRRDVQARTGPPLRDAVRSSSWLTGGYLWLQMLRLARR